MMQTLPGGANARPFVTHHNALGLDMYLRIAPELYLKRLVVGGMERVYEINRSFRNEGLSTRHNPEFTMLEVYWAYVSDREMMDLTEEMMRAMARTVLGREDLEYQGRRIDLAPAFERLTMEQALLRGEPDLDAGRLREAGYLRERLDAIGVDPGGAAGPGVLLTELFEQIVESRLHSPTFITGFPAEVSPLARRSDEDPFLTDRFELFIAGREIANGFSELNDPEEQAARFNAQAEKKSQGDEEAMYFDADYIRALEYAMPPTGGLGIGVDRLVMLLTDSQSIRDVLLFPHLRPEDPDREASEGDPSGD